MTALHSLGDILRDADAALRQGRSAAASVQASGFSMLDAYLDGGLRGGELTLIGGAQGLGKTTLALQMLAHAARSGTGGVVISFEHDAASVLTRLLASVSPAEHDIDPLNTQKVRAALELVDGRAGGLSERLADVPGGHEALNAFDEIAGRVLIHQATGATTDLPTISAVVRQAMARLGGTPLVVVDYLQKVPVPGSRATEDEQVTDVVEGLKDLAVETGCPVVAIVAADKEALAAGTRLRVHHLRGSSSLAYESDIILLLNDKYDIVARHHLVFNTTSAERFRSWAVLSIEKNRSGLQGVDLQLLKRFDQSRFDTDAQPVPEQLVDDRVFVE